MKLKIPICAIVIMLLSACSSEVSIVEATTTAETTEALNETTDSGSEINEEDFTETGIDSDAGFNARLMSNYMNQNYYAISENWLYGPDYDSSGKVGLYKIKHDGSEKILLSASGTGYICELNGWIYYLSDDIETNRDVIKKVRSSGKDDQVIVRPSNPNAYIDSLQLYHDTLLYSEIDVDENTERLYTGRYNSCDLDGNNVHTIINKEIYYPYAFDDKIYYQDDTDNESLHYCNLDGTNDNTLINDHVYAYVFLGNNVYYYTHDDSNLNVMKIYNTKTNEINDFLPEKHISFFAINGDNLYYCDDDDDGRLYKYDLETKNIELESNADYINQIGVYKSFMIYRDCTANYAKTEDFKLKYYDQYSASSLFE